MNQEDDASNWKRLTPDIVHKIAGSLHPNIVVENLTCLDSETHSALRDQYNTFILGKKHHNHEPERWKGTFRAEKPWPSRAFVDNWGRPEPWRALTLPRRRQLLCLAASSGDVASLDAALSRCGCAVPVEALTAAAAAGSPACCERLLLAGDGRISKRAVAAAAGSGQLRVLQLLLDEVESVEDMGDDAWEEYVHAAAGGAAEAGQAGVLAWLQQEHDYSLDTEALQAAARGGQLELIEEVLMPQLLAPAAAAAAAEAEAAAAQQEAPGAVEAEASEEMTEAQAWALAESQSQRKQVVDVLGCVFEGFPLEVMQRHFPRLWPWPAALAGGGGGGDDNEGEDPVAAGHAFDPLEAMNESTEARLTSNSITELLAACVSSRTEDWAAKAHLLMTSLRPQEVRRALGSFFFNWRGGLLDRAAEHPDFAQRLRYLVDSRFPVSAVSAQVVALENGHADALKLLWDEAGVRVPGQQEHWVEVALQLNSVADTPWREPCVRLLWERGLVTSCRDLIRHAVAASAEVPRAETLAWVMRELEVKCGGAAAGVAEQASRLFSAAARRGADLQLLQLLRERWGAAIDLEAVACGGSVEALEWAAAQPASSLKQPNLAGYEVVRVRQVGNLAAADWLEAQGLVDAGRQPPKVDQAAQMMHAMQMMNAQGAGFFVLQEP